MSSRQAISGTQVKTPVDSGKREQQLIFPQFSQSNTSAPIPEPSVGWQWRQEEGVKEGGVHSRGGGGDCLLDCVRATGKGRDGRRYRKVNFSL